MKGTRTPPAKAQRPVATVPRAPSWLSDEARAEWRRVAPELVERKTLTEGDMGALENYCLAAATVRQMEAQLQRDGHVIPGARGGLVKHPAAQIQASALVTARHLATELGLTPASRSRPAIREDDDLDELL